MAEDLLEACLAAPKFGLNAKALILQAAMQDDDEVDDEGAPAAKRPRPGA